MLFDFFEPLFVRVLVDHGAFAPQLTGESFGITLVVLPRDQLVLAARKKLDEVAEELPRFGEAAVFVELQARHIAAQQNPVVYLVKHDAFWHDVFKKRFAKGVKRGERNALTALA